MFKTGPSCTSWLCSHNIFIYIAAYSVCVPVYVHARLARINFKNGITNHPMKYVWPIFKKTLLALMVELFRGVRGSDFTDWTSIHIRSMILQIIIFQSNPIHGLIKFNPNPIHTSADRMRI